MIPPTHPAIPPDDEIPIVPALVEPRRRVPRDLPSMPMFLVRTILIVLAIGMSTILGVSIWLNPYDEDGQPRRMETHRQLGLPPCNFVMLSGKPCPSCGMTTSFAMLAHGDVWNSLRANWVGTLLAAYWFGLIPWAILSAYRGRAQWVRSGEWLITWSLVIFMVLALGRWVYVLLI